MLLLLLRVVTEKLFRLLLSMLPFRGLFVCHVRALCSNGRRYERDFLCIQQPHALPDRVKIQLIPVNPFFPKFCPKDKVTRPLLIWASGDIRWQIVAEWLAIAQRGHNGEPIGNHNRSFEWYHRWRLRPLLSQNGDGLKMHSRTNFATRADTWRIW